MRVVKLVVVVVTDSTGELASLPCVFAWGPGKAQDASLHFTS